MNESESKKQWPTLTVPLLCSGNCPSMLDLSDYSCLPIALRGTHVTGRKTEVQGSSVSALISKCQSQDLNPDEPAPEPTLSIPTLHLPHTSYQ